LAFETAVEWRRQLNASAVRRHAQWSCWFTGSIHAWQTVYLKWKR